MSIRIHLVVLSKVILAPGVVTTARDEQITSNSSFLQREHFFLGFYKFSTQELPISFLVYLRLYLCWVWTLDGLYVSYYMSQANAHTLQYSYLINTKIFHILLGSTGGGGGNREVSGLAACSENCKWYSPLPIGAVVSLFCESV